MDLGRGRVFGISSVILVGLGEGICGRVVSFDRLLVGPDDKCGALSVGSYRRS